jgi:hypothetical protein
MALKKLDARSETGIAYHDYSLALGDTNFPVKLFLESEGAKAHPAFAASLKDSMKWYAAAANVWERQDELGVDYGFCNPYALISEHPNVEDTYFLGRDAKLLCAEYPELVRPETEYGKDRPAITFVVARWDALKRASFYLSNADHLFRGEQPDKPDEKLLKVDDETANKEILHEAEIGLGIVK